MAISDPKRVQTLINRAAAAAQEMQAAAAELIALRTRYQNITPAISVAGTPLAGNLTALNTWITDVDAVANRAIANTVIAAAVPSHRGDAV